MGLIIYIDGGSRGNPGPAGAGVVIQTESGERIHEAGYFLGRQTNNAAEYLALIHALQRAAALGEQPLRVYSDSELLVRQITGEYRVKNSKLQRLYEQAQLLLLRVPRWTMQHVRRERNRRADELANKAMDAGRHVLDFDIDGAAAASGPGGKVDTTPSQAAKKDTATSPAAAAPGAATASSTASASTDRTVRVVVASAPAAGLCPAACRSGDSLEIGVVVPAGLCVHAAHALLPTVLAVQGTDAQEYQGLPTMTVRCAHAGCGATFHVSPARPGNGHATG